MCKTEAWSADLSLSSHFRNLMKEVCGKFRNPRLNHPFRPKKPQVGTLVRSSEGQF